MLKDITIGQYFPGNSVIHKMDSRFKIVLNMAFLVVLFVANNYFSLLLCTAFALVLYLMSHIQFKFILKSLKPVVPLLLFTSILNLIFMSGSGEPLLDLGFFKLYREAIDTSIFMIIRIFTLIAGMSLLTYTTSPIVLTDAIERLLSPLKIIRFPVHEMAMMMTIALRFIPTLIEETDKIMLAQKSRGADMEEGGLVKRIKAFVPIIVPLFVSAFKRANELALAMECRCYRGGEGRTRLRQLKSALRDYVAVLLFIALYAIVIVINIYL